jgi:hypothetical protein
MNRRFEEYEKEIEKKVKGKRMKERNENKEE